MTWHVIKKRFGIPLPILLLALLGALAWQAFGPRDRLLHGKRESDWIKGISYYGDEAQLKRLPEFLRAMQDGDENIRNNATVALRWYSGHAPEVAPVLLKALHDPYIHARMQVAKALARVELQAGLRAGIVPVAIEILKNPDDQVAYQAAELLGQMGAEPALALPALTEAAQGTNALVASTAARALARFPKQAR